MSQALDVTDQAVAYRTLSGLLHPVQRLRHITGFVTVYGEDVDPRQEVFARLWHVRRVVATTRLLSPYWPGADRPRVLLLAWLHDLNRWPFAHNVERGLFDQSKNTMDYLKSLRGVELAEHDQHDLMRIQRKDLDGLSDEGIIVLLSDAIAGILEDPLMLVTGLNVHPGIVPGKIRRLIGFHLDSPAWYQRAEGLTRCLHTHGASTDVRLFQSGFHRLFLSQARDFLAVMTARRPLNADRVMATVREVKSTFIVPKVFPINNEMVCRSGWLKSKVMPWYLNRFSRPDLVDLTEEDFVERATGDHSPFSREDFRPDLDAYCREHPDGTVLTCDAVKVANAF